ncbi:MAG: hypothetical protein LBP32_07010 [Spirochaetaceae bacterium]|jgi:hypothetical protein|nr:hypothetical protein [Spirochaetaceae bacterium]
MAKISIEARHLYAKKTEAYREVIETILGQEKHLVTAVQQEPENAAPLRIALVDEMLNLTSYYIILSKISQSVLQNKNEDALNDGRKTLYRSIIYLEETVSNRVDVPFSEYEDKLVQLEPIDSDKRYRLICKMGLCIDLLEDAYGDNTKWRWSFVDMEGRYAAVAKNILDLKKAVANTDPRSVFYESTVYHLWLVKKLLDQTADRYREMYELSSHRIDDFRTGIHFLGALQRLYILLGDREKAEVIKKKSDIWSAKLETDLRKQHDASSKKA